MKLLCSPALLAIVVGLVPARGSAAPTTCEPVAQVSGAVELAGPVRRQLDRLGVRATSARACRQAVKVHVELHGARISLRLEASSGDPVAMVVSNARTAAVIIESYARPDLGDPLLRPAVSRPRRQRVASLTRGVTPVVVAVSAPPTPVTVAAAASVRSEARAALSVSTGIAFASDASLWQSVAVTATMPFRGLRVGGSIRYTQSERYAYRDDLLSVDRNTKEAFALAALPRRFGRVSLEPSVHAGISSLFSERYEPPVNSRWSDVYCLVPGAADSLECVAGAPLFVGDGFALASFNILAGVQVDTAVALWRGFSLELGGGFDWLPTGGGEARLPPYVQRELAMDSSFPTEYFELPASPSFFWRLNIGVRAAL